MLLKTSFKIPIIGDFFLVSICQLCIYIYTTMANFERQNLKHSYYWSGSETPVATMKRLRFHDSHSLDIDDGEEVLHFINCYMLLKNYSMASTFHKIEKIIKTELPESKRSHNKIKRWLNENYFF